MTKRIIAILTMLLLIVFPIIGEAKEFPKLPDVSLDKVFTVTFSDSVDPNTINRNYINIYEGSKKIPLYNLVFSISEDGEKVFISNDDKYSPDTEYILEIRNPKSAKGVTLNEITTLEFKTKAILPTPEPEDPNSGSYVIPGAPTMFQNCTDMRVYYPNGVKVGHPAYANKHDRDGDGWACER